MKHGTHSGYAHHGCRCEDCTLANRFYIAQFRRAAVRRGVPEWVDHGLSAYNNWGCRCALCYDAKSEDNARYRRERVQL